MNQDRLPQIGGSLKRQPALRIAHGYSPQQPIERPDSQILRPERAPFSLWRLSLIVVPTVAALVSTSLLAYLLLGQGPNPYAQLQQVEQQQAQPQQTPPQDAQRELAQNGQQPSVPQQANPEPQEPAGPPPAVPNDAVVLTLIRSALTALWQANLTGNYSVLRDMGAPSFQQANNGEQLSQVFAVLRERNFDLSAILLIEPKLYRKAAIGPKGKLRIVGFFPTQPEMTNFDLIFEPAQGGRWRIFGISANYSPWPQPAAAQAPQAAPAQDPAVKATAPKPKAEAPKAPEKPKAEVDIRDRIDAAPTQPSPPEKPQPQEENSNPFER